MSNFVYTPVMAKILQGGIDLENDDIRVMLVMSNTTGDTEEDTEFISDLTTLDEMDGANYARTALASEAVTADTANDRGEFDAADITFTSLGAGTRQVVGAVLYKYNASDDAADLIAYIDSGGFPFTASGANVTITWNAEGILQLANA